MIPYTWIEEAGQRIRPHIHRTPLTYDADSPNGDVYIKWENHQVTGSFKARGAFNKVLSLQKWELEKGLVAASAGNHGQGLALAGKMTNARVIVFASDHAVPAKIEAMRKLGADVRIISGGYAEAEVAGIEYARTTGATWVSPYNDGQVIAGQATVGVEILEQLPPHLRSTWLIPTGGGGLISGIGIALERAEPRPRLVGVQSTASPFLHAIFYTGTQDGIVELPSLADGLAGPVEDGSVTIPLVRRYVDDIILVTEQEIVQAIVTCWNRYGEVIEGSSAVTLAALMSGKISQRPVVALVSGGNIQPEMHAKLIQSWDLVNKER